MSKKCQSYPLATLLVCVMVTCLLLLTACHETSEKKTPPPTPVSVLTLAPRTMAAVLEYVGVAQSSHLVEIRARVEGYLQKIAYREGEAVQIDDLLFQIDPLPFEAVLAQAKGLAAQQEALLWQAQRALERFKPLYAQKAASLRDLDNATAQVLSAEASVEATKAQVLQAEINLGYTTIRSPINGMSNRAKYREGSLVGPGSEQSLLTTLYTLDPIWVDFNVSVGDILKYRTMSENGLFTFPPDMNFSIEVVLSDGSIMPTTGRVDFADPVLQQSTGSMNVRAILPNPNKIVRPGQFVRARLLGATYPQALAVPQRAVMQGAKGLFVYVVLDGKVAMRPVQPGDWHGQDWIIESGLKAGDVVIVDGINKVLPNMPVTIEKQLEPNS